jgi:hypothetical protein
MSTKPPEVCLGRKVYRACADCRRERDEARALLIEEQQARHAAGTRVAQLERLLREAQQWVQEGPPSVKGLDDAITAALNPPSPAGASGQPSGSTPAASSVTPSSSEVEGSPSAPHGTREGGAA